jgi:murein DD-endopeptidase MepM/ murein hydrolase activator NlpD
VVARVRAGTPVRAGDPLGVLAAGHPGCPAAACLHWGLLRGSLYLDPLALLGLGAVRLWPLQPGDAVVALGRSPPGESLSAGGLRARASAPAAS